MEAALEKGHADQRGKPPLRWLGWLFAVAALALLLPLAPKAEWIQDSRSWFLAHPVSGPLLYFTAYVLGGVLFLPGTWLSAGAGFLFGVYEGFAISLAASVAAAAISFEVARHTARCGIWDRLRAHRYFRSLDHAIGEKGALMIGLLRLSPSIHFGIGNCLYGLTSVKFWPYVAATALGLIPGAFTFAYLGHMSGPVFLSGQKADRTLLEWIGLGVGLAATVGVSFYLSRKARSYLKGSLLG
jgi:uncharacterized membrane protein YdjX (TVP38/TMEM64 family)